MPDEQTVSPSSGDSTAANQGKASLSGGAVHGSITGLNTGTINNTYYQQPATNVQQDNNLSTDLRRVSREYAQAVDDLLQKQKMFMTLLLGQELNTAFGQERHDAYLTAQKRMNTLFDQISILGSDPVIARAEDLRNTTGNAGGVNQSQVKGATKQFFAAVRNELGSKDA